MDSVYITPEHELLREQVARFIAREVEPFASAWEEQGQVPREVLRKMGDAGMLGPAGVRVGWATFACGMLMCAAGFTGVSAYLEVVTGPTIGSFVVWVWLTARAVR